jgi:hypothetical protein
MLSLPKFARPMARLCLLMVCVCGMVGTAAMAAERDGKNVNDASAVAFNYVVADVARDIDTMTAMLHPRIRAFADGGVLRYASTGAPDFDVHAAQSKIHTRWTGSSHAMSVQIQFTDPKEGIINYALILAQDNGKWKVLYCNPSCVAALYLEFMQKVAAAQ